MDNTDPQQILLPAIFLLIAIAFVSVALLRAEQARSQQAHALNRARTKRAYLCFLVLGVLMVTISAVLFGTAALPFEVQQGYGMIMGLFAGVPAAITLLIGIFHALMVWRVPLIKGLLLPTITVLTVFFTNELLSTYFSTSLWVDVIIICYMLMIIAVSVRGLCSLGKKGESE